LSEPVQESAPVRNRSFLIACFIIYNPEKFLWHRPCLTGDMKSILLVDDEKQILQSLAEGLCCYGYDWNVITAENGKQGAAIIDSQLVDVVVTDLRMPLMDGYELLQYIRKTKPDLPVIIMTADWMPELESRLSPLGSVQCMKKPFDLGEMVTSISSQLVCRARMVHEKEHIAHR
jgi:DNA-binding NtrC family response regulator